MSPGKQASYLRTAISYIDNLPLLMDHGSREAVLFDLDRCKRTIASVIQSLESPEPDPAASGDT